MRNHSKEKSILGEIVPPVLLLLISLVILPISGTRLHNNSAYYLNHANDIVASNSLSEIMNTRTLDERPVADSLAAELPGITGVLCGDLVLPETAAIVAKASLVISNDSAIMHLGFELGTPTVGIFGPTDHEKYGHEGPKFRIARGDPAQCSCDSDKLPRAERSCFHGLKPEKVTELSLELINAA